MKNKQVVSIIVTEIWQYFFLPVSSKEKKIKRTQSQCENKKNDKLFQVENAG